MKKFLLLLACGIALASVNINTATQEELMELPGIGEVKAKEIIKYREAKKFESIDEIKNIKGIGDKRFDMIKDDLSITGETDIKNLKSNKKEKKSSKKADKKAENIEN